MTPGEPMVEARGLTRRFGAIRALDGVDLAVGHGEALAVFGPNGAGKTTLCRILTSSLTPTGGSIRIAGKDPRQEEAETRSVLGLISHQTFLYDDLTALENLTFFAKMYGVREPRRRALDLLDSVELGERAEDRVRTFSRGMQQRVALARALIHDPEVVFLDEPFTGLDPHAATVLRGMLERLRREGRTLVLVTHDLARGLELSDRWAILARGRIVAEGASTGVDRLSFEEFYFQTVAAPAGGPGAPS